jgi:hypothetical protein
MANHSCRFVRAVNILAIPRQYFPYLPSSGKYLLTNRNLLDNFTVTTFVLLQREPWQTYSIKACFSSSP